MSEKNEKIGVLPDSLTVHERADKISEEIDLAVAGVEAALINLRNAQERAESFFDELEMDPDEGDFDNPPEVARELVDKWGVIPVQGEIEALFNFPDRDTPSVDT